MKCVAMMGCNVRDGACVNAVRLTVAAQGPSAHQLCRTTSRGLATTQVFIVQPRWKRGPAERVGHAAAAARLQEARELVRAVPGWEVCGEETVAFQGGRAHLGKGQVARIAQAIAAANGRGVPLRAAAKAALAEPGAADLRSQEVDVPTGADDDGAAAAAAAGAATADHDDEAEEAEEATAEEAAEEETAARASISTTNSGRAKPETTISVEAVFGSPRSASSRARMYPGRCSLPLTYAFSRTMCSRPAPEAARMAPMF
mmetsp:Transcript_41776/g.135548  ORF Transcript_41776/g.135548 Transcript_41776/m.135548 type:complete len:259 (-) Transcript_41776:355-1131(-)